jgi:hypothetical protein
LGESIKNLHDHLDTYKKELGEKREDDGRTLFSQIKNAVQDIENELEADKQQKSILVQRR